MVVSPSKKQMLGKEKMALCCTRVDMDIRKNIVTNEPVRDWNRLLREVVKSPSWGYLKDK